jgi:hypothetical protein
MHGIHLTAALTTALAIVVFGIAIHRLRLPTNERLVWLAAAIALPLQPLAFYGVRVPLDRWLVAHLESSAPIYTWLTSLYAPLTEEAAKLVLLLVPAIFRDIRTANFVRYALAIGIGFAIGEMWFVADRIARTPAFDDLPFYQFGGYTVERLMTCVFHSAFISVALWRLRRHFVLGFAGAVALHWLGNFPLFLMAWDVGGLGKTAWMVLIQCFLVLYFLAAVALLSKFSWGRFAPAKIFYDRRVCPECEAAYDPPLIGINFGRTRYERCPQCKRWHWTKGVGPATSPRP